MPLSSRFVFSKSTPLSQQTILAATAIALLSACASTPMNQAPVVERSTTTAISKAPAPNTAVPAALPSVSGVTNANAASTTGTRPAVATPPALPASSTTTAAPRVVPVVDAKSYVVKRGDTLYSIALDHGLSYREVAEWNGITNPSYIQIDQVLRLTAPVAAVTSPISGNSTVSVTPVSTPIGTGQASTGSVAQSAPISMPVTAPAVVSTAPTTAVGSPASAPVAVVAPTVPALGDITWQWPAKGKMVQGFAEGKSKGIDIAGNMGDAVNAAADGKVVYAGNALKGYGQMLIVKHSDIYLTAYAHNSKLLVKEDAMVKRGQKIAEMGNTESDNGQIKLHFELRRSGKPVDPIKLLPAQ